MRGYPRDPAIPFDWDGQINHNSPQAAGLVAWWNPLVGDPSTARDILRGNNATAVGTVPTLVPDAQMGRAFSYGGAGNFSAADRLDWDVASITASCWAYAITTGSWRALIAREAAFGLFQDTSNPPKLYVYVVTAGGTIGGLTTRSFTINAWHHLACAYQVGAPVIGYIDGVGEALSATSTGILATYNPVELGARDSSLRFTGRIGPALFHSCGLPSSVIAQMYNPATRWDLCRILRRYWAVKPSAVGMLLLRTNKKGNKLGDWAGGKQA